MLYEYEDQFLIKKVDDTALQKLEDDALLQAQKLGIADDLYKKQYVQAYVYTQIAKRNIEADGMKDKYEIYSKELDRVYDLAKTNSPSNFYTIPIGRG